jgi:hypothetical protein
MLSTARSLPGGGSAAEQARVRRGWKRNMASREAEAGGGRCTRAVGGSSVVAQPSPCFGPSPVPLQGDAADRRSGEGVDGRAHRQRKRARRCRRPHANGKGSAASLRASARPRTSRRRGLKSQARVGKKKVSRRRTLRWSSTPDALGMSVTQAVASSLRALSSTSRPPCLPAAVSAMTPSRPPVSPAASWLAEHGLG